MITDLNNPHVLGLDAREVFFAEEDLLVVEGQEDVLTLRRVSADLGVAIDRTFFGWGAGGAEKAALILSVLRDLGFADVATLLDGDKATESAKLQLEFPEYLHVVLPALDIRDKPERNTAAKAGICNSKGEIKDEHRAAMTSVLQSLAVSAPRSPSSETQDVESAPSTDTKGDGAPA